MPPTGRLLNRAVGRGRVCTADADFPIAGAESNLADEADDRHHVVGLADNNSMLLDGELRPRRCFGALSLFAAALQGHTSAHARLRLVAREAPRPFIRAGGHVSAIWPFPKLGPFKRRVHGRDTVPVQFHSPRPREHFSSPSSVHFLDSSIPLERKALFSPGQYTRDPFNSSLSQYPFGSLHTTSQ